MKVKEFKELLQEKGARDEDEITLADGREPDVKIKHANPGANGTGVVIQIVGWFRDK